MSAKSGSTKSTVFQVKVLRQEGPGKEQYWELHKIQYEVEMNVISVLQKLAAQSQTASGADVAPVAWECNCLEEVCGACTMVINGKVQQACTALVDRLLDEKPNEIELRPMSKFPVQRDLVVERQRAFRALEKLKTWVPVEGYYDMGPGMRQSREEQEAAYPLSQCMTCACCMEACPQYTLLDVPRLESESDEAYTQRRNEIFDQSFVGPAAISQTVLFNSNPIGKMNAVERLEALTEPGGIQVCGNAQNCVVVCPKEIPLTTSIGRAGRAVTLFKLKKWFGPS